MRDGEQRATRPPQDERVPAPPLPDDVVFSDLDRSVRGRLRSLSKDNAERVGRHLVVVGLLLDTDPELAYEHAQAAVRRAGRIDVVREAAGLAAYRTGRFAEALRELRTVRRLNGSSEHLPIMADCERGLGRPERAIALANEPEAESLDATGRVELAIVVSGARLDLGQTEAAVAVLSSPAVQQQTGVLGVRVAQARATALEAAGRADEATSLLARYTAAELAEAAGEVDEEVVVFDLEEDEDSTDLGDDEADPGEAAAAPRDGASELGEAAAADGDGASDVPGTPAESGEVAEDDEDESVDHGEGDGDARASAALDGEDDGDARASAALDAEDDGEDGASIVADAGHEGASVAVEVEDEGGDGTRAVVARDDEEEDA